MFLDTLVAAEADCAGDILIKTIAIIKQKSHGH